MIESGGLAWPQEASSYNLGGSGIGGIQDKLPASSMVTAVAATYGCTAGRLVKETGGEYFIETQKDDSIVAGVKWRWP